MATALASLGVYFGDPADFQPADNFNEGGYWEIQEQQVLNARILAALGMNYYQVDRLPSDWPELPGSTAMVGELAGLLQKKFSNQPRWGWKEPATSVLMPIYREALAGLGVTKPAYAICVRHPLSVAASQMTRQKSWSDMEEGADESLPVIERTVGLWVHYTLSSLHQSRGAARVLVSYESFLENPKPFLQALTALAPSWKPTSEQMDAAVATVKPGWSHSRYTAADLDDWPEIVGAVYRLCLELEADPTGFASGRYDTKIEEVWNEWLTQSRMIRPGVLPVGHMVLSWRGPGGPGQSLEKYHPTGGWQRVKVSCPAPAGTVVQIDPYQTPCQIWIRNAVWRMGSEEKRAVLNAGPYGMVQDLLGMKRVTVFGPAPLLTQVPPGAERAVLELEFLVKSGPSVLLDVISTVRGRVEQSRSAPPSPFTMRRS